MLAGGRDRANWVRNIRHDPRVHLRIDSQRFAGVARDIEGGPDDGLARRLLLEKYEGRDEPGSLGSWARSALPVAIDLEPQGLVAKAVVSARDPTVPGSDLALATHGLQKRYGSRVALAGLELSVPAGVVYGFLGPNGAGKTTTMRLLTGLPSGARRTGVPGPSRTIPAEMRSLPSPISSCTAAPVAGCATRRGRCSVTLLCARASGRPGDTRRCRARHRDRSGLAARLLRVDPGRRARRSAARARDERREGPAPADRRPGRLIARWAAPT